MDYEKIGCLEPNNPECLCSACLDFFENGLKRVSRLDYDRNIVYLAQKDFIFKQIDNNLGLREVIYG